ncbi:MAG: AAA family ATPase [Clostridia bacterium]|nr:AAA family ATPase [Clostridia bacterium]
MQYLKSFRLPSDDAEVSFILSNHPKIMMQCYSNNDFYPFKLFPQKGLTHLDFEPITIFYGGNGSGKSTLLNVIAQALHLRRIAPFNYTPFYEEYLRLCSFELCFGQHAPEDSTILTSDDVFDFLLDIRTINQGVDRKREALFDEYDRMRDPNAPTWQMQSLSDYEELRERNDARRRTKSDFTTRRLPKNLVGHSNGESAFECFTSRITDNALFLLDEPENSLSVTLQQKLAAFLEESVRFYNCQLVISTHSPFLLALKGAKIYDLDTTPVRTARWTELENVRAYYEFFKQNEKAFE